MKTKKAGFVLMAFCITLTVALPIFAQKVVVEELANTGQQVSPERRDPQSNKNAAR